MAATKKPTVAKDFQEIIQGDRQRRKNEALAKQIFGKGRRSSAPGAGAPAKKHGTGLSLADRITTTKQRSSSTVLNPTSFKPGTVKQLPRRSIVPPGNVNADWTHDLHNINNDSSSRDAIQRGRRGRLNASSQAARSTATALSRVKDNQFNIIQPSRAGNGMSIRGLAGPYTVIAENFAPGTTAADIESAMVPMGGPIIKCIMTAANPVTAEITFESKDGADNVIAQFHNQTADGLLLSLYHKVPATVPTKQAPTTITPTGPRAGTDRYYPARDSSRDRRRNDNVQDSSSSFDNRMEFDDNNRSNDRGRLYSDRLVGGQGRGRGGPRGVDRGRAFR